MTKIKVNVKFKAEAYFDAVLELRPDNVKKVKNIYWEKEDNTWKRRRGRQMDKDTFLQRRV